MWLSEELHHQPESHESWFWKVLSSGQKLGPQHHQRGRCSLSLSFSCLRTSGPQDPETLISFDPLITSWVRKLFHKSDLSRA